MVEERSAVKQADGSRDLQILTYVDIWKNLIDFKKYLSKLVRSYESSSQGKEDMSLAQVYVPLKAEYRRYEAESQLESQLELSLLSSSDKQTKSEARKEYDVIWQGNAEEVVKHWLVHPTSSRLALLADFGSGKTSFCQHLAATLAKEYLESGSNEQYVRRFPLVIPLLEFAKIPVDLENFLIAFLKRRCGVDNPDFDALMKMAEAGYLFFILDGFDEMASRANEDIIRQNIDLFEELANLPKNKVLLTTRPEYFTNLNQEREVLRLYPSIYLQLFDNDQIDLYLQKRVPLIEYHGSKLPSNWEEYRRQIDNIHDLTDLVRRPVLLEMVIKTLPILIDKNKIINRPNLYQSYLEAELTRQVITKKRRDLLIKSHKRFEIMEQIALELYYTGKAELTSNRIREISRDLLTMEEQEELEGSLREIVTCSFLVRRGSSRYSFSHQSFLEYLVACHLAKEINLARQTRPARELNSTSYANSVSDSTRSISGYLETFRLRPISRTIRDFLLELNSNFIQRSGTDSESTIVSFDYTYLVSWFTKHPTDKWVSTNAISLLARLLPHDLFCQLPLKNADLREVDLSGIDLRNADLHDADLRDADLSYANLWHANLTGTNLQDANLGNAILVGARLDYAKLGGANLSGADLSHSRLIGTDLNNADLRDSKLINVRLFGTKMRNADIRGMDSSGTDLRMAYLTDAKEDVSAL